MTTNNRAECSEVWVTVGEMSMCALINGERGWLMFLRHPGDPGFSSRNPDYDGPADAVIEYRLDNGQGDEYPASWAYPVAIVRHALDYFRRNNKRPPFITWDAD